MHRSAENSSADLAAYLADREGLTGAARERFLRFLDQSLGFHRPPRSGNWRIMGMLTLGLGVVGVIVDVFIQGPNLPPERLAVWILGLGLGGILVGLLRRAEGSVPAVDLATQWRVYCLILRPHILTEHPGLLDRNLQDDQSVHEQLTVRPFTVWKLMVTERNADFWWSSLIGLWIGIIILIFCQYVIGPWGIGLLLVLGVGLGPVVWALWQWGAFRWAMRGRN